MGTHEYQGLPVIFTLNCNIKSFEILNSQLITNIVPYFDNDNVDIAVDYLLMLGQLMLSKKKIHNLTKMIVLPEEAYMKLSNYGIILSDYVHRNNIYRIIETMIKKYFRNRCHYGTRCRSLSPNSKFICSRMHSDTVDNDKMNLLLKLWGIILIEQGMIFLNHGLPYRCKGVFIDENNIIYDFFDKYPLYFLYNAKPYKEHENDLKGKEYIFNGIKYQHIILGKNFTCCECANKKPHNHYRGT